MKRLFILAATALLLFSSGALAADYDAVILNGRVMDPETGFDGIANVGISSGWITRITEKPITGAETIDAKGLVVAPGFIDLEQHALTPWGFKVNLRDGVTTHMDLEVGAANIAEWYAKREGTLQGNFGTTIGHEFARMRVHDGLKLAGPDISMPIALNFRADAQEDGVNGWSVTPSTVDQINTITKILDEGLREGAIGIGNLGGYSQKGITTYELLEVQRTGARWGRPTTSHHRFHPGATPPTEAPIGADELMANAMLVDAPMMIHHNNDYGWWEIEEKMQFARAKGYNFWSTWYPWDAGSGNVGADIVQPGIWEEKMGFKTEETIYDPVQDRFLTRDEVIKLGKEEPAKMIIAFSPPRKEWMKEWFKVPEFVVASDAMPPVDKDGNFLKWDSPYEDYVGHPRTAGSHARVLRMAREEGVPLMFTLSQLSYWSAKHVGDTGLKSMQVRGRLQEGMVADITIFDPKTVTEHASYKAGSNGLASTGIPYVLVHGTLVVKDSKVLPDVFPGQPIRFPPEKKGRHVDATRKAWLGKHTIDDCGLSNSVIDHLQK